MPASHLIVSPYTKAWMYRVETVKRLSEKASRSLWQRFCIRVHEGVDNLVVEQTKKIIKNPKAFYEIFACNYTPKINRHRRAVKQKPHQPINGKTHF